METKIYSMDNKKPYAYELTDDNRDMKLIKFVDDDNNLTRVEFSYSNILDNNKKIVNFNIDEQTFHVAISENMNIENPNEWNGNEESFCFENTGEHVKFTHYEKKKDTGIMTRHTMYPNDDKYVESIENYYKDEDEFKSSSIDISNDECLLRTKEILYSEKINNLLNMSLEFADFKTGEIFNEEFINAGITNHFINKIENQENKTR